MGGVIQIGDNKVMTFNFCWLCSLTKLWPSVFFNKTFAMSLKWKQVIGLAL